MLVSWPSFISLTSLFSVIESKFSIGEHAMIRCFESARQRSSRFCKDREWEKFHLPASIALALAGECGEVCEIFQWKGLLETEPTKESAFTEKQMINIGEEIADVFIYSTRLCEVCCIDLAQVVKDKLDGMDPVSIQLRRPSLDIPQWGDLSLDDLSTRVLSVHQSKFRSQRHVSLSLQSEVGGICKLFASRSERQSATGLPMWTNQDVSLLANHVATICILLACLANFSNHNLSICISEKFAKNEAKYPADLARGSNAKYTAYSDSVAARRQQQEQQKIYVDMKNAFDAKLDSDSNYTPAGKWIKTGQIISVLLVGVGLGFALSINRGSHVWNC